MGELTPKKFVRRARDYGSAGGTLLAGFGIAAVLVAAATLVRYGMGFFGPGLTPYPTFFVAVLFTTLLAGIAPGAFAMFLGAVFGSLFLSDPGLTLPGIISASALYFGTSLLVILGADHFRRLVRHSQAEEAQRKRHEELIADQNEILERIAAGAPLPEVFDKLVRAIETFSDHTMLGSILLLDRDGVHLRHGAAPSLPPAYSRAIDGAAIGPAAGSCGTAAYRRQPVFVSDIEHDPLWADYRELALAHGLRACWSTPILSRTSAVLGTFAIYYREPRSPSPDDIEIISYANRTASIAIQRDQIETQRRMLVNEMNHRVKNTLATVQSIALQTLRNSNGLQAYQSFSARLAGLADAHDLLVKGQSDSVEFHDLVTRAVSKPFASSMHRVRAEGPTVRLPPEMTLLMAMALHELCTNAAKYGALSNGEGTVSITWNTSVTAEGRRMLNLHWAESGGPRVKPPTRQGFGARLIERALASELGGTAAIDYRPEGVACDISAPLVAEPAAPPISPSQQPAPLAHGEACVN
jgi:two-component sensor histidine kinase